MATPESSPAAPPSAQVVGNAFVEQYYHILHHSPELVHRFYQDSSALSRPDSSGAMTTVLTMKAINEKILSLNFEEYTAEIKTADAQYSFGKGVIVLVTGCLTGKDEVKKKFTQSFFLAPQDKGFYVLNDVFRFVEESETAQIESASAKSVSEITEEASQPIEQVVEPTHVPDHLVVEETTPYDEEEDLNNVPEVCDPSENEDGSVIEEEVIEPPTISTENIILSKSIDVAPEIQEDAPKKSYASILKEMRAHTTPNPTHVPNRVVRPAAINIEQQPINSEKPAPPVEAAPVPSESVASEGEAVHEVEGHSIYVRNLPYDATVEQLEEEFKKFGPIKREGVQVRSSKQQGFCFGFVEFESVTAMQSALESSPITIGDRQAVIEEKRTSTRGGGGRGKFSSGRGSFRGDSFRGRSSFGGGGGGGRNYGGRSGEYRSEYSGRGRGGGRDGGYQRQNGGRGTAGRSTGPPNNRSAVVS